MKKYSPRIRLNPEEYEMILKFRGESTDYIDILANKIAKKLKTKERTIVELADIFNIAPKEIRLALQAQQQVRVNGH